MRLVGPSGEQVGVVRVEDALRLAEEAGLDLVEVAPDARPPVCKLMDYGTKMGHVERFLKGGDKVKCIVRFRGREQSRPELGIRLLRRVAEEVSELGNVESHPRQDGRNMVMVLAPTRRKAEVKSDQRRRREEARANRRAEKHAGRARRAPAAGANRRGHRSGA